MTRRKKPMRTLPLDPPLALQVPARFSVATYPPGATFGPRVLRNWEFVWLLEGNAVYLRDNEEFDTPENAIVLCRPGATDAFRWDKTRRTRHAYFHFEMTGAFPPSWGDVDTWPHVRPAAPQNDDLLRPLFRHLLAWSGRGDTMQTQFIALGLLAAFVTGQTASGDAHAVTATALPEPVARALAFIARRLDDDPSLPLPLAAIAQAACVTPEYLCRVFKRATGHSPSETVRLARLDRAATLLARSNYAVGEIATLCGFESQFHFARCFKTAWGQTPRAYRLSVALGNTVPLSLLHHSTHAPPFR